MSCVSVVINTDMQHDEVTVTGLLSIMYVTGDRHVNNAAFFWRRKLVFTTWIAYINTSEVVNTKIFASRDHEL